MNQRVYFFGGGKAEGTKDMKAILGFFENGAGVLLKYLFGDLLATIRRKTMHHESSWICRSNEVFVDLVSF